MNLLTFIIYSIVVGLVGMLVGESYRKDYQADYDEIEVDLEIAETALNDIIHELESSSEIDREWLIERANEGLIHHWGKKL